MRGQYGDIILVHGDSLFSDAVQNITQSVFSHAALCTEPGKIAEMTTIGFRHWSNHFISENRPFAVFRHRRLLYPNRRTYFHIKKMRECINGFSKNPPKYDYFEILNQALKLILFRGDQIVKNGETYIPFSLLLLAGERLICSALVDTVYERAGIDLFPGRKARHTTPADIARLATGSDPSLLEIYRSPNFL